MLEFQMHATMPAGDLNSGPHVCSASSLTSRQSTLLKVLCRDVLSFLLAEMQGRVTGPCIEPPEWAVGHLLK